MRVWVLTQLALDRNRLEARRGNPSAASNNTDGSGTEAIDEEDDVYVLRLPER